MDEIKIKELHKKVKNLNENSYDSIWAQLSVPKLYSKQNSRIVLSEI